MLFEIMGSAKSPDSLLVEARRIVVLIDMLASAWRKPETYIVKLLQSL